MFALNFISIELENPFGLDANDLPLTHFQFLGAMSRMRCRHRGQVVGPQAVFEPAVDIVCEPAVFEHNFHEELWVCGIYTEAVINQTLVLV